MRVRINAQRLENGAHVLGLLRGLRKRLHAWRHLRHLRLLILLLRLLRLLHLLILLLLHLLLLLLLHLLLLLLHLLLLHTHTGRRRRRRVPNLRNLLKVRARIDVGGRRGEVELSAPCGAGRAGVRRRVARVRGASLAYLRWCGATRAARLPVRSWRLMANLRTVVDIARANAVRVVLDP